MINNRFQFTRSKELLSKRKEHVSLIRSRSYRLFQGGATGIQVASEYANDLEDFLKEVYKANLDELPEEDRNLLKKQSALIAIGGSGRGELVPYSDTDLLFLFHGKARLIFSEFASQVVRDYWDAGIQLGHSVRSLSETMSMAKGEIQVSSSLVESRLLSGSKNLFSKFQKQFKKQILVKRKRWFIEECISARKEERIQFGETGCELEPDVKKSYGGLRDLHLIRWLSMACYGEHDIASLRLKGGISKEEAEKLLAASDFLLKIRIDLHFKADRAQDLLTRDEQLRICTDRGIEASEGQRPVERFMQKYFKHTRAIRDFTERFINLNNSHPIMVRTFGYLASHRAERIYLVSQNQIDVVPRFRKKVCGSLDGILHFFLTASLYRNNPSPRMIEAIKEASVKFDDSISKDSQKCFLMILNNTGQISQILRLMNQCGILELVIPQFKHAQCLLQFNQYHSYTVDEHSFKVIEAAEELEHDEGPLGIAARKIKQKDILYLALLLHDIGKGYKESHSEVGRRIAEDVADRLSLTDHQKDILVFLVHKHLRMDYLARTRDISDPQLLLEFSQEVGSPETLNMLYVLTASDIMGVGPGTWTEWKSELITELYDRTKLILTGKAYKSQEEKLIAKIRKEVISTFVPVGDDREVETIEKWVDKNLKILPRHYISSTTPERIASDLQIIENLKSGDLIIEVEYNSDSEGIDVRIITHEDLYSGMFHKITGLLTAKNLEVYSAQINTSINGVAIDIYRVIDRDFSGETPDHRLLEIKDSIEDLLLNPADVTTLIVSNQRFNTKTTPGPVSNLPTRVTIDNHSSDQFTVIDVFAYDRPGLLYTIARAIYKQGLSVVIAKIATHFDQVVDVFYTVDMDGNKIDDGHQLKTIRDELQNKIDQFEKEGYQAFVSKRNS